MICDIMTPHHIYTMLFSRGLRPLLKKFVVTMQEDTREHDVSIVLDALHARTRAQCENSNRPVFITIATWQFWFHPMYVRILFQKYEYSAWSEGRFARYPHCYVTWCPLTDTSFSPRNARLNQLYQVETWLQRMCENNWKLYSLFSYNWAAESHYNYVSDLHAVYGVTHPLSLSIKYLTHISRVSCQKGPICLA